MHSALREQVDKCYMLEGKHLLHTRRHVSLTQGHLTYLYGMMNGTFPELAYGRVRALYKAI